MIFAFLIAFLPRIFRFFYPYAWFEDSAYIYHAFAFKSGLKPFVDTICVHLPTLEYLLAGLYTLFGTSYLIAEILSAFVVFLSAIFLFDIAKRIFDNYIGLIVTAVFSLSSLLFRYHIFEREVFTLAITIFILWFLVREKFNGLYALIIGILAGLSFAIKFSGIFVLPAIIGYLLIKHKYRAILIALSGFILISASCYGYFLLKYKSPAYYQLFVFHFFKGYDATVKTRFLNTFIRDLNYLWVLGSSGIILSLFIPNRILLFPIILFVEYTIFFLFISATCWPHNMIDMLLPLSLANGVSLFYLRRLSDKTRKNILAVMSIIFGGLIFILFGAPRPEYYQGLGYVPRNEVAKISKLIREHTPANLPIHAPHYIAIEAQRLKIIDYEELIGPYRLMISKLNQKSRVSGENIYSKGWYDLIEETLPLWRDELNKAIVEKKVSCAVWDKIFPEWSLMLNIDKYLETQYGLFSNAGYYVNYNSRYYTIWFAR